MTNNLFQPGSPDGPPALKIEKAEPKKVSKADRLGNVVGAITGLVALATGAVLVLSAAWWAIAWLWTNMPS